MKYRFCYAAVLLAAPATACTISLGGPAYPGAGVVVSTETVQAVQTQIVEALALGNQTGVLRLELDEGQLTAHLAAQLATQPSPLSADPQVLLRDGTMTVYGTAQSGLFRATIELVARVDVDQTGVAQVQITEADLGPMPAPDSWREAVNAFLREALTGALGPSAIGFRLESIEIADGVMAITGRTR
jgi:hypothetical protein